jgi:hypothetical protein
MFIAALTIEKKLARDRASTAIRVATSTSEMANSSYVLVQLRPFFPVKVTNRKEISRKFASCESRSVNETMTSQRYTASVHFDKDHKRA